MNILSCGPKVSMYHFGNFGRHFPALHPQKSSQHKRACAAGDGAICSKNRKIVPYPWVGTAPIPEIARAYGLRPRLWLLLKHDTGIK